jgi:hypothetical protein
VLREIGDSALVGGEPIVELAAHPTERPYRLAQADAAALPGPAAPLVVRASGGAP